MLAKLLHKSLGSCAVDEKGRQVYSCPICGKKILQASLKNHLKFHDEKSLTFKCDACDKSYCTSSSLAYHKRVAHRPDATPGMSTIIPCGEPVDSGKDDVYVAACQQPANGLHVDPIAGVRRQSRVLQKYPCRHCSLVLVGRLRLARHLVAHHGDEAGELCDWCGKEFRGLNRLLRHVRIHQHRDRNLQCSFCPKKYFRR